MNEKLEKLINKAKSTKLSVEEKSTMLNNIGSFITDKKLHDKQSEVPSPYVMIYQYDRQYFSMKTFLNFAHRKYVPLAILLILVLGTTGASAAANNALPGDALYPIKINVNEKVESLLAVGTKAKAEIHLKQAERRMAEAERLSEKNKLTPQIKDQIKSDFTNRTSDLDNELDTLTKRGDKESVKDISKRFESKIADHASKFNSESDGDFKDFLRSKSDSNHVKYNSDEDNDEGDQSISNPDDQSQNQSDKKIEKKKSDGNRIKNISDDEGDDGDDEDDDDGNSGGPVINPTPLPPVSSNSTFTLADVAKHNTKTSCYTAINGSVYDVTGFISQHPGGSSAILSLCGKDGSAAFDGQHGGQSRPASELASFKIGTLK